MYAANLYETNPLPVLLCGGNPGPPYTESFARTMGSVLAKSGVPEDSIWLEERSSSTYENAVFAAGLLRTKHIRKILLVTNAYHMLRAERCFRKQGFEVIPGPVKFQQVTWDLDDLIPNPRAIQQSERVLHEIGGLAWYALRGRI